MHFFTKRDDVMTDRLSAYGSSFQLKIISAILGDRLYLQQISDIMKPEYFESEATSWIVKQTLEYFEQYKSPPSIDVFKSKTMSISRDVLQLAIVEALREVVRFMDSDDLQFVKDETLRFCKNQCIKKAILESVEDLKLGRYDDIKLKIDTAMKAGEAVYTGYDYVDTVESRYTELVRNCIPTPWPVVNDLLGGGAAKGELVVFVAGPGAGKSTSLINVGAEALRKGKVVVHYTLELYEPYVAQRYDAVISGIATQDLKYHISDIKSVLSKLPGKLELQYYPTKTASCNTIRAHLGKLKLAGVNPDLLIVDYADLLRVSGRASDSKHIDLENIYEDLRGVAGEFEVPIYTASQAGRQSAESDVVQGEHVAGAFAKIMIADAVISLSRKVSDKISGTGRFFFIKNRFGPDGITLPSRLNMSNGQFQIFEETSVQGTETKKVIANGADVVRQTLAQKYKEINGGSLG